VLRGKGYINIFMQKVDNLTPGKRIVGRARTLRYLPSRPDFMADLPGGEKWLPYQAMSLCGPGDVLVVDAAFHTEVGVAGDVMLLQLKMAGAEGIVTDGGLRDLHQVAAYGLKVFAGGVTHRGAPPVIIPSDFNEPIQCGGTLVRPGDIVVGDNNGLLVVPKSQAEEVIAAAEEREQMEEFVIKRIQDERCIPGRYYPITPQVAELYRKNTGKK
jgi:regulator of RNase E activity RraA